MFGSVSAWFFNWLGGIQVDAETVAFDRFSIHPQLVEQLDWVKCRYDSIRGPIVCNWRRQAEMVEVEIEVPTGATASVYLPAVDPDGIFEGDGRADEAPGIRVVREGGDTIVLRVESGRYRFTIHPASTKAN
jgi:alpha-L-rhamnosidase